MRMMSRSISFPSGASAPSGWRPSRLGLRGFGLLLAAVRFIGVLLLRFAIWAERNLGGESNDSFHRSGAGATAAIGPAKTIPAMIAPRWQRGWRKTDYFFELIGTSHVIFVPFLGRGSILRVPP